MGEVVDVSEMDAVAAQDEAAQSQVVVETPNPDDELPEEFKGKSAAEIARIAQHARREMGRQANELGEVRRLSDEIIKSQLYRKPAPDSQPEVDLFENPQEYVRKMVDNNPKVLQAEQYALQAHRTQTQQQLIQKHPDFADVLKDQEFGKWIQSSKIRQQLYQAAEGYDIDAADELLSTFKQLKGAKQARQAVTLSENEKTARTHSLNAASVDSGGTGESSKKVFRRTDLLKMMQFDRAKYESMQDEISEAYRTGRVK